MLGHEFEVEARTAAVPNLPHELGRLVPDAKPLTIVMAVHPECPCTAASLEQLDRLMTRNPHSIQTVALFWAEETDTAPSPAVDNEYHRRLSVLPNVTIVADPGGKKAESFGAVVSGSVAAYDAEGNLRFQGGLTASRGHAGSSAGMDMLEAIARGRIPGNVAETPAFGCALEENSGS
jgi:hypothetical protein